MTLREVFSSIANAIRSKTGKTDTIQPVNMATEIESIQTGSGGNPMQEYVNNNGGDGKPSCNYLFYNYQGTSLDYALNGLDTSKVTDMSYMFAYCSKLTSIPLFDTSKVTNMSSMFYNCNKLTSIPLFDASIVADMSSMFYQCSSLTTIPQLDTSNVTNMISMFYGCRNLTTIPLLDTSKVTNMNGMFYNCNKLTSILQLDTSNVTTMSSMFYYCNKLNNIHLLDTSKVTNMEGTFKYCFLLTSISPLNTNKVTNMFDMFSGCNRLEKIDITKLVSGSSYNSQFARECYSLKTLIIRTMDTIPTLSNNAFTNCYHFYGTINETYNPEGLKDGAIYVPDDKVEELKVATNWSTFADIIKPLSGYVEV